MREFFRELDQGWNLPVRDKIPLHVIGSTALMLQADYERRTKDSDVLETSELDSATRSRLLEHAGTGTKLHRRHRLFLEGVANGLPLLPHAPHWMALTEPNRDLVHFHIEVLSIVDVVVSKLKRFWPSDVSDIEAMVSRKLVPHEAFVERFRSAVDCFTHDARADQLPTCVENFHRVERDLFGRSKTEIELPPWVGGQSHQRAGCPRSQAGGLFPPPLAERPAG